MVTVWGLFATGLQFHSIVSTELVQPDQLTDETIEILGVTKNAPSMTLLIAHINVQPKYVTGRIPAAVMNDPIFPLILGVNIFTSLNLEIMC